MAPLAKKIPDPWLSLFADLKMADSQRKLLNAFQLPVSYMFSSTKQQVFFFDRLYPRLFDLQ